MFGVKHAKQFGGINAGLVHEHSGSCAIDIDDKAAAAEWLQERGVSLRALLKDEHAVTVSSGKENHAKLLYRIAKDLPTIKIPDVKLEFRCKGAQDVIAGDHPEGGEYIVHGDVAKMPMLPDELKKIWREQISSPKARPRSGDIPDGKRDDTLYPMARSMHAAGFNESEILAALGEANKRCKPPLPEAEIEDMAEHADTQPDRPLPTKPTIAEQLISIGQQCSLFHDERNDAYAVAMDGDVQRVLRLRGREFRRWMCGSFYTATSKAANGEAIASALGVLEAQATFNAPQHALANRFAEYEGAIYIDLCNKEWQAVRVTAEGWVIVNKPPLLFRRYSHQQPLPKPKAGGDLKDLAKFMHLRSDNDRRLVESFIVAAPFANDPRPALDLNGPQGAAKTTTARVLKSLLDPSATDTVEFGRDPAALAQVLDHNAVPIFDNLTHITAGWASDLLCKAVTGGGVQKRELYTDGEDVIYAFKRAMIFTGINVPTHAPDLLDRMLLIELDRIDETKRRDEREFWKDYNRARPRLFGALLDGVAGVLRERDLVREKLKRLPRMADFALLACAYAESTGFGAEKMLQVILDNTAQQTVEAIESDSLAVAVRDLGSWDGTPTALFQLLSEPFAGGRAVKPDDWPRSARGLGKRLRILATPLADVGVQVAFIKSTDKSRTRLIKIVGVAVRNQTSDSSETSDPTEPRGRSADVADVSDVSQRASTSPPSRDPAYMRFRRLLTERRRKRWGKQQCT